MFAKRRSFNHKRCFGNQLSAEDLPRLAERVRYGGNSEHKRNPGNFGLIPPASPRPDKTLCDGAEIFTREDALLLLQQGIERGLISKQERNGYPQNVWAVTEQGIPVESQLENSANGTYHGYPMPIQDPFRKEVLGRWSASNE